MAEETQSTGQQEDSGIWPDSAGEQDIGGLVPPYDGRTKARGESESSDELTGTIDRQLEETHGPGKAGATTSPMQESPVRPDEVDRSAARGAGDSTATDTTAASPHGVGQSVTRRGEDVVEDEGKEPGRTDLGTKGPTSRPVGTSDQRDSTSVDPQDLANDDMPDTFTGDQGG